MFVFATLTLATRPLPNDLFDLYISDLKVFLHISAIWFTRFDQVAYFRDTFYTESNSPYTNNLIRTHKDMNHVNSSTLNLLNSVCFQEAVTHLK